jgi:hypothetical protein
VGRRGTAHRGVRAFGSLWAVQTGTGSTDDVTETTDGSSVDYRLDGLVRIDPDDGTTLATIDDLGTELVLAATDDAGGSRANAPANRAGCGASTRTPTASRSSSRATVSAVTSRSGPTCSSRAGERLWAAGNCDAMPCPPAAARVRIIDPATSEVTTLDGALPDELLLSTATAIDGRLRLAGLALGRRARRRAAQGLLVAVEPTGDTIWVALMPDGTLVPVR